MYQNYQFIGKVLVFLTLDVIDDAYSIYSHIYMHKQTKMETSLTQRKNCEALNGKNVKRQNPIDKILNKSPSLININLKLRIQSNKMHLF